MLVEIICQGFGFVMIINELSVVSTHEFVNDCELYVDSFHGQMDVHDVSLLCMIAQ